MFSRSAVCNAPDAFQPLSGGDTRSFVSTCYDRVVGSPGWFHPGRRVGRCNFRVVQFSRPGARECGGRSARLVWGWPRLQSPCVYPRLHRHGRAGLHRRWDLIEQGYDLRGVIPAGRGKGLRDDLAGGFIDAEVQLAPPMLADFPFAFSIDFQPGGIHDQVHRRVARLNRQIHLSAGLAPRQWGVIGHRSINVHQCQDQTEQALGLAQGQGIEQAHHQRRSNRQVRIGVGRSPLGRALIIPRLDRLRCQLQRQTARCLNLHRKPPNSGSDRLATTATRWRCHDRFLI